MLNVYEVTIRMQRGWDHSFCHPAVHAATAHRPAAYGQVQGNSFSIQAVEDEIDAFALQVVHGDIKLDNIVITKDLKNVALCDFGTAGEH